MISILEDSPAPMALTETERQRYSRHLLLPEVGIEGQQRLRQARVLIVGVGGLGAPAALYLTAAGIGTLGLIDPDAVDVTNLQRQVLYTTADVGRPKVTVARERLAALDPSVRFEAFPERLSVGNAAEIIRGFDVVLDGADNFPTRYLVNDACVMLGKPNVHGSIFRFEGQVSVFGVGSGPCYRCLFPAPPPPGVVPSCAEAGVLGVLPAVIGALQATEAIKLILGLGQLLAGRLLLYDALAARIREVAFARRADCAVCGDNPTITQLTEVVPTCDLPHVTSEYPMTTPGGLPFEIAPEEVKRRLDAGEKLVVVDVRKPEELLICKLAGATPIPLDELPKRFRELDPDDEIIVHCRSGGRSSQAVAFLRQQGYPNARNLTGGILAWADKIDPTITKY